MAEFNKTQIKDVFFLGAGFDKEYEQPLMRDFCDDFESLYGDSVVHLKNHCFLSLTEQRILHEDAVLQNDLDLYFRIVKKLKMELQSDIEEILDFAYTNLDEETRRIFFCLFHYVLFLRELKFYRSKTYFDHSKSEGCRFLYHAILQGSGVDSQENVVVITTNYTAFVEREHPKGDREQNSRSYPIQSVSADYFGTTAELDYPCALKLHGAQVFYKEKNTRNLLLKFTDEGKSFATYESFKLSRGNLGEHLDNQGFHEQIIIPPIKNKRKLIENSEYLKKIWNCAEKELFSAHRVFFIGYSFNNEDTEVEELLSKAKLEEKRVVIISGSGHFNKNKCRNLFNDRRHLKCDARTFVEHYTKNRFCDFIENAELF